MIDMDRRMSEIKYWRQLYILKVITRKRSKILFYTGQTIDIGVRMYEHIHHINSKFLTKYHYNDRKILVFVGWSYGDENDVCYNEKKIKNFRQDKKKELISSNKNKLIKYVPCKHIIFKGYNIGIQKLSKFRSRPPELKQTL